MNPQQMNAYSYAMSNPINKSDPQGLAAKTGSALFSSNFPLATLELYGYISTLKDANDYFSNGPKSPLTQRNQEAQLQLDVVTGVAGIFATAPQALTLTVGGVVLQGVDAYCANRTCKDFSAAANSTPATVLASLRPAPGTVPSPYNLKTPVVNYGTQSQRGGQANSSVYNSPAGAQFISSLQSFVTSLSAYVSTLSPSSGSRVNNTTNR